MTANRAIQLLVLGMFMATGYKAIAESKLPTSPLTYSVEYQLSVNLKEQGLDVQISIEPADLVHSLRFTNTNLRFQHLKANGKLVETGQLVHWTPGKGKSTLAYFVPINHAKNKEQFDAYMTSTWALFRGDDVIPTVITDYEDNTESRSIMTIKLPQGWKSETAWPKSKLDKTHNTYVIDNPERKFDRPFGWILLGDIGSRRAKVSGTSLVVAAPKKSGVRRMDALTFFSFVWPQVKKTFGTVPEKLLIAGAPDPMWRGGLSAPNSLYLHADRPMVSENGTSPLFHEITHLITRISGVVTATTNDDWIAEGLAEYYSFELLYKAHGISKLRKKKILNKLAVWGKDIKHLRLSKSSGPVTARAVVLMAELDEEIKLITQGRSSLDEVTRQLMKRRKVSLDDLQEIVQDIIGQNSKTLQSPLLK